MASHRLMVVNMLVWKMNNVSKLDTSLLSYHCIQYRWSSQFRWWWYLPAAITSKVSGYLQYWKPLLLEIKYSGVYPKRRLQYRVFLREGMLHLKSGKVVLQGGVFLPPILFPRVIGYVNTKAQCTPEVTCNTILMNMRRVVKAATLSHHNTLLVERQGCAGMQQDTITSVADTWTTHCILMPFSLHLFMSVESGGLDFWQPPI